MSNHVIHVKLCHLCQIMSFMSNHGIYVKSCQPFVILAFSGQTFTKVGREGRVKNVCLGLRQQLLCPSEGKNIIKASWSWNIYFQVVRASLSRRPLLPTLASLRGEQRAPLVVLRGRPPRPSSTDVLRSRGSSGGGQISGAGKKEYKLLKNSL
jgi:hypothetical protein